MNENQLSYAIIGAAIEVHKHLGPGLLESVYEAGMAHEYVLRQLPFERQKPVLVKYKGVELEVGFRLDFLVGGLVVVELKAVERILPIHEAQLLNYLKLTGCKLGPLLNFNVKQMMDGVQRLVNNL